jgi:hypothetical protein
MVKPLNPVIPDYTPKGQKVAKDVGLPLKPCLVCQKMSQAYGSWIDGHTCSRKCEAIQQEKPRCFGE